MTRQFCSLARAIYLRSLVASFLLSCALCTCSAVAQVSFPPGSYGIWSSSMQLSASTASCQPTPANGLKLIQNRGVVGILLSVGWQDVEIADGVFDWSQVDSRMQEAAVCGVAVEMTLVIGLWHTPDWLLDPSYGIQTIGLINQNKYQPDCGVAHLTPVYWDPTLQSYRIRFITEAANRYASYGNLVAVIANPMGSSNDDWSVPSSIGSVTCLAGSHTGQTIPFNNLQPWLDAGYNPAQEQPSSVVFNAAVAIIDATAAAFPLQSVKLPIQVTHELLDGTKTALAEAVLNYAYGAYPGRFFAQLNFLKTDSPLATDPSLATADPNNGKYLFKLLRDYAPQGVGIQMAAAAINGANPGDNCRLNDSVHPCSPYDNPPVSYSSVLQSAVDVGLSYMPNFIEYWNGDSRTLTTADDIDAMRQVLIDATYAMGGVPRGEI
jgi:hypothetical protein